MSKQKKQYYVVVHGRAPGIYNQWFGEGGAANQVTNFPEAIYKGFYTREEAIAWLKELGKDTLSALAPNLLDLLYDSPPASQSENIEELLQNGKVVIHTDGSVFVNPGAGGYAAILRHKAHRKVISGGFQNTTNNRMELMACIEGLKALKQKSSVVIFSDSRYVVDAMTEGWTIKWRANGWIKNDKSKVSNIDLWKKLLDLCGQHNVEFRWIRGHYVDKNNERCDYLAMQAARQPNLQVDTGFINGNSQSQSPLL